jgi:hypothetical protein
MARDVVTATVMSTARFIADGMLTSPIQSIAGTNHFL